MSDDAQIVRQQRRETRIARRDELAALARFMADPAGRRWLYNLLASCNVYSTSFRTNALAMAFSEGERSIGLRVTVDMAEASPDMFLQMHKDMVMNERRPEQDAAGTDSEPDIDT